MLSVRALAGVDEGALAQHVLVGRFDDDALNQHAVAAHRYAAAGHINEQFAVSRGSRATADGETSFEALIPFADRVRRLKVDERFVSSGLGGAFQALDERPELGEPS
ncbi:hypothetical protein [Novosphingobium sp. PP1Y]|uniref:hypothetical protein n=1 Tax=Novosphingobium sp. PP1Y TaxID=702113 RepID=UPI0005A2C894|nr:hypothetical protein [Novosphingobium sp. PP1Y]